MTDEQRKKLTELYDRGYDIAMQYKCAMPWVYAIGYASGYLEGYSNGVGKPMTKTEAEALVIEAIEIDQHDVELLWGPDVGAEIIPA